LRNVYLGTSDFAATVLAALLDSLHAPSLVVTRPARPKGRGKKLLDPPVALLAKERGVECFQPEDVNLPESFERISAVSPQAITVCAFGAIIKEPLLSAVPSFNVHPSLLPRWRGAAPIERAIAAGDEQAGVTIMQLVAELDAGPFCSQSSIEVDDRDYGELAADLSSLGGQVLVEALDLAQRGELLWREQLEGTDASQITYAEKIAREDRLLKPKTQSATEIERTVRALNPHIGALLELAGGEPMRIERTKLAGVALAPGEIRAADGRLFVGTTEETVELLIVRPAGGRSMDVESFLRGNEVPQLA
jgi:methionyl-tRNA formyltransferase